MPRSSKATSSAAFRSITRIKIDGKQARLIDAPAFTCLQKQPGIAVVDLQNKAHFRETVSVLPQAVRGRRTTSGPCSTCPPGSLTQRTLTWAFRVHQERPACTNGTADPTMMDHADRHSLNQAKSNSMYHSGTFPGSFEIVAQSWMSNANIADVAVDLVNLWRSSAPHWGAAITPWSRLRRRHADQRQRLVRHGRLPVSGSRRLELIGSRTGDGGSARFRIGHCRKWRHHRPRLSRCRPVRWAG